MNNDKLKKNLSKIQFDVTQNCSTEKPFDNEYWDHKEEGIYVDIIDGTPLFCSVHKYDSGSGWPSFYKSIDVSNILSYEDYKLGYKRIEVKSKKAKSHLGHIFNDGPKPTGQRYCINSASLKFIPKNKLKNSKYEYLLTLFKNNE